MPKTEAEKAAKRARKRQDAEALANAEGLDVLPDIKRLFLEDEQTRNDFMDVLFTDKDVMKMPDPEYIIEGWLPRGFFTIVYGEPGVMKTFALLGMSRAVRRGTRWQDNKTTKGGVLFFQGEGLAQLKQRIMSWDSRYPLRNDQSMAPGALLDEFVDLTKPKGVAAVIRTVRLYEELHKTKVQLLVIDPLVEFMNGKETEDGMDNVTKGLRALAKYLNIGVVVGHHTNASGERARGTDHHRMRAGAHILMERLSGDSVGLLQHKQKNAQTLALVLDVFEEGESLVLEWSRSMLASDYVAMKEADRKRKQENAKAGQVDTKRKKAESLLIDVVKAEPGISQTKLLKACQGQSIGKEFLEEVLKIISSPDIGKLRIEEGARNANLYYPPK